MDLLSVFEILNEFEEILGDKGRPLALFYDLTGDGKGTIRIPAAGIVRSGDIDSEDNPIGFLNLNYS